MEIARVMSKFYVWAYFGDPRENSAMKFSVLKELTQDHHIFDGSLWCNWTVVVSSYQTLTQRHGPSMQTQWRRKELEMPENQLKDLMQIPDPKWLCYLHGVFCTLVLDEAHQL